MEQKSNSVQIIRNPATARCYHRTSVVLLVYQNNVSWHSDVAPT